MVSLKVFLIPVKSDAIPQVLIFTLWKWLALGQLVQQLSCPFFPKGHSLQDYLTVLGRESSQLHLTYVRRGLVRTLCPQVQDRVAGQGRPSSPSDQLSSFPWTPSYDVCQFC